MHHDLVVGIALAFLAANPAAAYEPSQHQWRLRLLLLVAPDVDDPDLKAQRHEFALHRDAIVDRDLRVFRLYPDHGYVEEDTLPAQAVAQLREQLE